MLNADTYNLWFASLRAGALEGEVLTLQVRDEFCEFAGQRFGVNAQVIAPRLEREALWPSA